MLSSQSDKCWMELIKAKVAYLLLEFSDVNMAYEYLRKIKNATFPKLSSLGCLNLSILLKFCKTCFGKYVDKE